MVSPWQEWEGNDQPDLELLVRPPCPFWTDLDEVRYFLPHALYYLPKSRLTTRWEVVVHLVFLVSPGT